MGSMSLSKGAARLFIAVCYCVMIINIPALSAFSVIRVSKSFPVVRPSTRLFAASTAPAPTTSPAQFAEPKFFLRGLMSSRVPEDEKARMLQQLRKMQGSEIFKERVQYQTFFDQLFEEVESEKAKRWAAASRLFLPLPSYRIKLGALRRLVDIYLDDEIKERYSGETSESLRKRALSAILSQLVRAQSVRMLEREATARTKPAAALTMQDMLERTPTGLETPKYKVIYTPKKKSARWEARQYEDFSVCSYNMTAGAAAGGQAFNSLAGYIFGKNQASEKMAMTTPVISKQDKMSFVLPSKYWNSASLGGVNQEVAPPPPMPSALVSLEGASQGLLRRERIGESTEMTEMTKMTDMTEMKEGKERKDVEKVEGMEESVRVVAPLQVLGVRWFGGFASEREVAKQKRELLEMIEEDPDWVIDQGGEEDNSIDGDSSISIEETALMDSMVVMQYNDPFQPPWKRRNEVAVPIKPSSSAAAASASSV